MKNNTFKTGVPNFWFPPKLLLIMKLIIVIMTTLLLQASANSFAQRVTLNEKNTTLEKILTKISLQTGYDFIGNNDLIKASNSVSIQVNNVSLDEALNILFAKQDLTNLIQDKAVVIKKRPSIFNRILDAIKATDIRGKVVDETGRPMPSAVVRIKNTNKTVITNSDGEFTLAKLEPDVVLQINYVGYEMKEIIVRDIKGYIEIKMIRSDNKLEEVNILSTGYEKIPKERATGSFETVSNELFNRSPGTNIISRLNGVTASTLFIGTNVPSPINPQNNSVAGRKFTVLDKTSIRGISTLQLSTGTMTPLIVLDNFPYDGDINNINPNDVENITILKDAAAASIWGIRASNGVIVINTKKSRYEQPIRLSLNTNVTIGEKPDLFYQKIISSSDYIDVEKFLFDKGFYNSRLTSSTLNAVSPVVDLLAKQRALPTTDIEGRANIDRQIEAFRQYDTRNDLSKYIYRQSVNQQYSLNITGGSKQLTYFISGGYDKNRDSEVEVDYEKINLRNRVTFRPVQNLEIQTDVFYTANKYRTASSLDMNTRIINHLPPQPYTRLADEQGNHLEVFNPAGYYIGLKNNYRKTAGNGRLLDWVYRPLDEIGISRSQSKSQNILMNIGANYKLNQVISASVSYQYGKNIDEGTSLASVKSYMMRENINLYATYSKTNINSPAKFNVPIGDRYSKTDIFQLTNSLRGQINFDKTWNNDHTINAIAGAERRENNQYGSPTTDLFGYKADPLSFQPFPYNQTVPLLNGLDNQLMPGPSIKGIQNIINRNTSIFINAAYNYKNRYTLSGSLRKDAANVFGVKVNRRGQPTWSIGSSWNISNESFFKPGILEYLKFRITYGYLGNVNTNISAYPIIAYSSLINFVTQLSYATVGNPPNPSLGPERSGVINLGLDFSLKNNRISGSLEYYDKRSMNLIAPTPLDLSTGFSSLSVNSANLKTTGVDLNINFINIRRSKFQWTSNLLFSYTHNVVTKYLLQEANNGSSFVPFGGGNLPNNIYLEGNDPFSLYTYRWAGLDPLTGDPMGYIDGQQSKDYNKLVNVRYDELENHGSVIPLYYGSFRNTITWKSFSLSANILYKLGYKLNPPGISYAALFNGNPQVDYNKRWQKQGDELTTNVPSFVYPANSQRDQFYQGSSARIISGDHIRLQDIRVGWGINNSNLYFKNIQLYANVNNVGIIWRANKVGIDPDTFTNPPIPTSVTVGLNASF